MNVIATAVSLGIRDAKSAPPEITPPVDGIPIAERILRLKDAEQIAGISRWTINDLEREGKFPQRIAITENVFGYRGHEVLAWRDARKRAKQGLLHFDA